MILHYLALTDNLTRQRNFFNYFQISNPDADQPDLPIQIDPFQAGECCFPYLFRGNNILRHRICPGHGTKILEANLENHGLCDLLPEREHPPILSAIQAFKRYFLPLSRLFSLLTFFNSAGGLERQSKRTVEYTYQRSVADLFKWLDGHAEDAEIVDYH
jgi:hypothetical protein